MGLHITYIRYVSAACILCLPFEAPMEFYAFFRKLHKSCLHRGMANFSILRQQNQNRHMHSQALVITNVK